MPNQKKAHAWGLQSWLKNAQMRTQEFYEHGPRGPVTWVLVHGKDFPRDPFPGGEENGETLYICRGFHDVSLRPTIQLYGPDVDRMQCS